MKNGLTLMLASLLLAASTLSAQNAPIVIKAGTVIDGTGGTLNNVAIVIRDRAP